MNKIFHWLSWLTIFTALSLIFLGGYWLAYPYKTLEIFNNPLVVSTKTIKAGQNVDFTLNYCKHISSESEITVSFVDGFIYNTTAIPSTLSTGCHIVTESLYVPKTIPAGIYSVVILYRYHPNPIRTIDITTNTEKFTIIK